MEKNVPIANVPDYYNALKTFWHLYIDSIKDNFFEPSKHSYCSFYTAEDKHSLKWEELQNVELLDEPGNDLERFIAFLCIKIFYKHGEICPIIYRTESNQIRTKHITMNLTEEVKKGLRDFIKAIPA